MELLRRLLLIVVMATVVARREDGREDDEELVNRRDAEEDYEDQLETSLAVDADHHSRLRRTGIRIKPRMIPLSYY